VAAVAVLAAIGRPAHRDGVPGCRGRRRRFLGRPPLSRGPAPGFASPAATSGGHSRARMRRAKTRQGTWWTCAWPPRQRPLQLASWTRGLQSRPSVVARDPMYRAARPAQTSMGPTRAAPRAPVFLLPPPFTERVDPREGTHLWSRDLAPSMPTHPHATRCKDRTAVLCRIFTTPNLPRPPGDPLENGTRRSPARSSDPPPLLVTKAAAPLRPHPRHPPHPPTAVCTGPSAGAVRPPPRHLQLLGGKLDRASGSRFLALPLRSGSLPTVRRNVGKAPYLFSPSSSTVPRPARRRLPDPNHTRGSAEFRPPGVGTVASYPAALARDGVADLDHRRGDLVRNVTSPPCRRSLALRSPRAAAGRHSAPARGRGACPGRPPEPPRLRTRRTRASRAPTSSPQYAPHLPGGARPRSALPLRGALPPPAPPFTSLPPAHAVPRIPARQWRESLLVAERRDPRAASARNRDLAEAPAARLAFRSATGRPAPYPRPSTAACLRRTHQSSPDAGAMGRALSILARAMLDIDH
jgi:hypothetical protein